jgi:hypothetical protein
MIYPSCQKLRFLVKHRLAPPLASAQLITIQAAQQQDHSLQSLTAPIPFITTFCGGGWSRLLIYHKNRIVLPSTIQIRIVEWYHEILCQPGMTRT